MRLRLILIHLLIISVATSSWAKLSDHVFCIRKNVLSTIVEGLGEKQDALLAAFSVDQIKQNTLRRLSGATWKVELQNGKKYVVRLPDGHNQPAFEKFASDFIQHVGGMITPKIRDLDPQQSLALSKLLGKEMEEFYSDRVSKGSDPRISISVFLDGFKNGSYYMKETLGKIELESPYGWEKLPSRVRQDVFDLWALTETLGIRDFHWDNWIIYKNRPVLIDTGYASSDFYMGKEEPFLKFFYPVPYARYLGPKARLKLLQENISPKMRVFLQQLSPEDVRAIAQESDFSVNDRQINGIVQRAKSIATFPLVESPTR
jgi:hypothetical protein